MRPRHVVAALSAMVCLSVVAGQTGCVYMRDRNIQTVGSVPDEAMVKEVKAGKTMRDELITLLGQPTSASKQGDTEVLKYTGCRTESRQTHIVGLFTSGTTTTTIIEHAFTLKNGVVQKIERAER